MRVTRGIALAALLVAGAGRAAAQRAAPSHTALWASVGGGKAYLPEGGDIAVHLEGTYQFGTSIVSVRAASAASILGAIVNAIFGAPGTVDAHDFAVLFGQATKPAAWYVSAAAGAGVAVIDRDSSGTRMTTRQFTFPVEAELAWRPLRHAGLVFCGFMSFNSRERFGGATFGLQLGRLR
jgi:hypothetical protein